MKYNLIALLDQRRPSQLQTGCLFLTGCYYFEGQVGNARNRFDFF
jgi:hypothetical protein